MKIDQVRPIAWLDLPSLPSLQRMVAEWFLDCPAPVGIGRRGRGQGRTFRDTLACADVTASEYFNIEGVDGRESWGVLATADMGAIVVPAELAKAATLPALPEDLERIAIKVGSVNDRLKEAILIARQSPRDGSLQSSVVTAAVEHAELHERLRVWRPAA